MKFKTKHLEIIVALTSPVFYVLALIAGISVVYDFINRQWHKTKLGLYLDMKAAVKDIMGYDKLQLNKAAMYVKMKKKKGDDLAYLVEIEETIAKRKEELEQNLKGNNL